MLDTMSRRKRKEPGCEVVLPAAPVPAQSYSHGNYRAPFTDQGREYMPTSPRTGNPAAHRRAELEYGESIDSVATTSESFGGGLWDFEQEAKLGPKRSKRGQLVRGDAEQMRAYLDKHGHEIASREVECGLMFLAPLSYTTIAERLGINRRTVMNLIQRLRRRMRG